MDFSLVVPTYNERPVIGEFLRRARRLKAAAVLVVDDRSTDGTGEEALRAASGDPRVRLLRREGPRSLAASLRQGIESTATPAVVWMDADLSMPVELVPDLVARLDDADVAIGSRYAEGGKDGRGDWTRTAPSRFFNAAAAAWTGSRVRDLTSGFVAARRSALEALPWSADYGEYCIDFLVRAQRRGFRAVEVPYENVPRPGGDSKTTASAARLLGHFYRYGRTVWELGRS